MKAVWLLGLLLAVTAGAQGAPESYVRLDFSNPALIPGQWQLVVHPDGSGHFHAERGKAPEPSAADMDPVTIDRDVQVSSTFAGRVFQTLQRHLPQDGRCESHSKVAFQGVKTLELSGPNGTRSCSFNFAKDKEIGEVADALGSVAATLVEGARVEMIWQYDPLGLDKELKYMSEAADDGRLQQICAIRSILERLREDPAVMEGVRKRARQLAQSNQ
ncbi:MAG: hypothetical protein WCA37_00360 [Terracidiphilus sp.]